MRELNDITVDYGGRMYIAKDSTLTQSRSRACAAEALATFATSKPLRPPRDA